VTPLADESAIVAGVLVSPGGAIENNELAALLDRLADLLEIEGANPFRVRAYRTAARTVRDLPGSIAALIAEGRDLAELPGIGRDLAEKLVEIVESGRFPALEEARARVPSGLVDLLELPGVGPKRAKALYEELGITTLDELAAALRAGRVHGRHGFGERTEQKLLHELERQTQPERRALLAEVEPTAQALVAHLRSARGVRRVVVAGSYRRRKETVRDLDLLVTAPDPTAATERLLSFEEVEDVLAHGPTRSTVRLHSGLQVDLRVVGEESYGAALCYFTGSVAHSVAVRRLAQRAGLKLNEYGVFRNGERLGGRTERDVFALVGLPYIAPELRENRGEVDAALAHRLPHLVRERDIRGDLRVHSSAGDGQGLRGLASAARERGYEYVAIADRTPGGGGRSHRHLREQLDEIERLNDEFEGRPVLLRSAEVEILEDGSLDLPERLLRRLDLTVCAVHTGFGLSRRRQIDRILRALDSPYFTILAHPTGRLVGESPRYELDLEHLIELVHDRGRFLELYARPGRLDLSDVHCRLAKERGVGVAISSGAASRAELGFLRFGVDQARRGWLEPADVLNTRPIAKLRRLIGRR
jgi:DNA polymerase (family X)